MNVESRQERKGKERGRGKGRKDAARRGCEEKKKRMKR
tara:strand:+ start:276 stop:389 length:114 start_codon:yes stop_codon:yes gene_type:complete